MFCIFLTLPILMLAIFIVQGRFKKVPHSRVWHSYYVFLHSEDIPRHKVGTPTQVLSLGHKITKNYPSRIKERENLPKLMAYDGI